MLAASGLAWLAWLGGDAVTRTGWPQAALFAVPAALLVAAGGLAAAGRRQGGLPARSLSALGDASYAVYLLHPFAVRGAARLFDAGALWPGSGLAGFGLAAFAATALLALAVHRWIERPATRLGRRLLDGSPPRTALAAGG